MRESVRRCSECDAVTPHSRRLVALPVVVALVLALLAGWCFTLGRGPALLGVVPLWGALLVFRADRDKGWHLHCGRCRAKLVRSVRRTKPTLGSNCEINILG